jgi:hypothetical protein
MTIPAKYFAHRREILLCEFDAIVGQLALTLLQLNHCERGINEDQDARIWVQFLGRCQLARNDQEASVSTMVNYSAIRFDEVCTNSKRDGTVHRAKG